MEKQAETLRVRKKDQTTERILLSAIRCFGRKGYNGASLAEIAKDAGVTAPLLVSRFGSKEGLLEAAYAKAYSWRFAKLPDGMGVVDRLISSVDEVKALYEADLDSFRLLKMVLLSTDLPESFCEGRKSRFQEAAIRGDIETAQAEGLLPDSEPWALFHAYFVGLFTHLDACMQMGIPVPHGKVYLSGIGFQFQGEGRQEDRLSLAGANRQKLLADFVKSRSDLAAVYDLEKGNFEVISAGEGYAGPLTGDIATVISGTAARVLPEFREEYERQASPEGIRAHLEETPEFNFQTFIQNADGTVSRKSSSYHALDESRNLVLVVRTDTTQTYEQEQAVSQARGAVSASSIPSSEFLNEVIASKEGRNRVLVVENSEINREILCEVLSDEYDVVYACDGQEGICALRDGLGEIDLVLLDVYMPVCDGFRFLEMAKADPALAAVPVVVATGSNHHEDEERCLRLGAVDFVTKPYDPKSLLERVRGAIRNRISAETISALEIDPVTGLYTFQAFCYHAQRMLSAGDARYSLGLIDIVDLAMVNSIHGERVGNQVLKYVAHELAKTLPQALVCRTGGRFHVLLPVDQPIQREEVRLLVDSARAGSPVPNLRFRVGICEDIAAGVPIASHCDRAKMAVQSLSGDTEDQVAFFDEAMEARKAWDLKMLSEFSDAVASGQFVAFAQPKVDSRSGQVVAAEALVRWFDADGAFVSPGQFIPLFEREGCIQELDEYIFASICRYQRQRQERGQRVVPVSVNLSRNSLFSPGISQRYRRIADEAGVDCSLVPLEITESAATSDKLISSICDSFVAAGFSLHMDDFGAGYSSLSSLASLPFAVLKLDKSLIDRLGDEKGAAVIRNAIDMARDLGMSVVAEGVEEKSQVDQLARMGCSLIQGYYYAAPMRLSAFDALLEEGVPFGAKTAVDVFAEGYPQMDKASFRRFLAISRSLFPTVRVLDAECCKVCMVDETGRQKAQCGNCYDAWGRTSRCENCTSLNAVASKTTLHKFELLDGEAYIVYSKYAEVEGEPCIVELIDKVSSGIVHGLKGEPSLIEAVTSSNGEIYRDVQLGTLNRRFFEERVEALEGISAIAFVDVDDLKAVNDSQGHDGGDRLLKSVAEALGHSVRKTDYVIRVGGDEFLVAFAGMGKGILEEKLRSISDAVRKAGASVSIGGCYAHGVTAQAVKAADHAMYEAKESGCGVCVVDEESSDNQSTE